MGRPPPAAMCAWICLLLLLEACAGHWRAQENKVLGASHASPTRSLGRQPCSRGTSCYAGGVLIDDNWVLTAAHCEKPRYTVRLGDHSLQNKSGSGQERAVAQSIPHPCFSGNSEDHNHDLMLLRLREPASTGPSVKPINLTDHCPRDGQKCTISGWGTITSPQESFPDTLNCAEVEIVSQKRCEDAYPGKVTEAMICAGDSSGADSCQGDSGGPLVCGGVLQGITSWGSDPCGQPQRPGVYTNLCRYLNWIKTTMGSRSSA